MIDESRSLIIMQRRQASNVKKPEPYKVKFDFNSSGSGFLILNYWV